MSLGPAPPPVPPLATRYKSRRRLLWIIIALLAASPFLYLGASCGYWFVWGYPRQITQRQRLILYKTNPNVLLSACRQIRAKQAAFRPNPDWHTTPPNNGEFPDSADPQMPPVIATLRPCSIAITPQGVHFELGG